MIEREVRCLSLILTTLLLASLASAGEPKLRRVLPRGAQRGTEVEIQLSGEHLREVIDLMFAGDGIEILGIGECADKAASVRLRIAPDCPLGLHALRVRTRTGLSNLRTFSVGSLTEVEEATNNDSLASAQLVPLDCTLLGIAKNEDVDYYAFDGKAGDRISAEIEGLRLGDAMFDPSIAILDGRGFELASCDDLALLRQDASVTLSLPEDGRYFLRVRECAYRGNDDCRYRLHLGHFPRPLALFPSGGAPGTTLKARIIGEELSSDEITILLPEEHEVDSRAAGWSVPGVHSVFVSDALGTAPSPNSVRVTDLPSTLEVEPNGSSKEATPWSLPGAVDGIISEPGDQDFYLFETKKNQEYHVRVFARSLRSPLDAVIGIRDAQGKAVKFNDDTGGPDSYIRFKAPADGEYSLEIRDQMGAGGPHYVYRVEAHPIQPYLWLEAPRNRQTLAVPRGGRAMLMLTATRMDCSGAFEFELPELPPGVSAEITRVPEGIDKFPVVLAATPEAELAQALTPVKSKLVDSDGKVTRTAGGGYRQDVELVLGRNRNIFWAHSVDRLAIAVVDPAPFAIEVVESAAPLVQSGSAHLHVKLARNEDFKGKVKLRVPFLPPGVNARQNMWIESGQNELHIPIDARGNAKVGDWFLVVEAEGYPGQGPLRVASAPILLKVRPPFVRFTAQATSVEVGEAAGLHVAVEKLEGFQGKAQVQVSGLPHHVSSTELTLDTNSESLEFELTTQGDSPLGRHKQLFCVATFETENGLVVHRLPAADLLINAPPVNVVAATPEPQLAIKAEPAAAKLKPPTRLEKLRLEHERVLASRLATEAATATPEGELETTARAQGPGKNSAQSPPPEQSAETAKVTQKSEVAAPVAEAIPAAQRGQVEESAQVQPGESPASDPGVERAPDSEQTSAAGEKESQASTPPRPTSDPKEQGDGKSKGDSSNAEGGS